mgnify:FL=1|jgi:hypothetical protein|tara:strand:- start:5016 stop:5429 length:414 start_codon:yes stop_codon:yes gene_type:complete
MSELTNYKALPCKKCGRIVENIDDETTSVVCSRCVQFSVGFPSGSKGGYKPTGKPPGWHFMSEFVDKDGNVFHKGKEQPNLKGTLPPTKVKPKRKTKRRTKEQILIDRHADKKKALKKALQKQKDFLNHNIQGDTSV